MRRQTAIDDRTLVVRDRRGAQGMGRDNIAGVVRVHRWRIPSARTLAQSFAMPPALQRNITMPRQSTNRAELEAVIAATVQSARSARNAEGETGCGV